MHLFKEFRSEDSIQIFFFIIIHYLESFNKLNLKKLMNIFTTEYLFLKQILHFDNKIYIQQDRVLNCYQCHKLKQIRYMAHLH